MAWDINRVILIGRLVKDIELKHLQDGTAVTKISIAVGGKKKEETSFFDLNVWGKAAESCATYLSKGDQIAVDGRLEQKSYTNKEGEKRSIVQITAERIEFLQTKGKKSESAPSVPDNVPTHGEAIDADFSQGDPNF